MKKGSRFGSVFPLGVAALATVAVTGAGCTEQGTIAEASESETTAQSALKVSEGASARVSCPCDVPAAVNPPADATLKSAFYAVGTQNYVCATPAAGGAPAWTLKAPHALLLRGLDTAAIHFAGPSWQALDGSVVVGTKTASAPAPDAANIPWLLLQASSHTGAGEFAPVSWIQRLSTAQGVAPATGCDDAHLGAETLVPYRAQYFFYVTAAPGYPIRQCASKQSPGGVVALRLDAAADGVLRAGDVAGAARGEERDHLGDLFRLPESLHRHLSQHGARQLLERGARRSPASRPRTSTSRSGPG